MPTINQLVRKSREDKVKKSKIKKQEESLIMYEILCGVYENTLCVYDTEKTTPGLYDNRAAELRGGDG